MIEAMKQALEALEEMQNAIYNIGGEHVIDLNFAIERADVAEITITSLRQAIEQAEKQGHEFVCGECVKCGASIEKREWVGLTDEEVISLMKHFPDNLTRDVARAIEAKLKEKNT